MGVSVEVRKASQHFRARVDEVVNFDEDYPGIDQAAMLKLVDLPLASEFSDRYRSSTVRCDARKLVIQEIHERCIASTATSLTCAAFCK